MNVCIQFFPKDISKECLATSIFIIKLSFRDVNVQPPTLHLPAVAPPTLKIQITSKVHLVIPRFFKKIFAKMHSNESANIQAGIDTAIAMSGRNNWPNANVGRSTLVARRIEDQPCDSMMHYQVSNVGGCS